MKTKRKHTDDASPNVSIQHARSLRRHHLCILLSGVVLAGFGVLQICNFMSLRFRSLSLLPSSESSTLKLYQRVSDIVRSGSSFQVLVNFSQDRVLEAKPADILSILKEKAYDNLKPTKVGNYIEGSMNFSVHKLLYRTFSMPSHTSFRIQGIKCIFQSNAFSGKFYLLHTPPPLLVYSTSLSSPPRNSNSRIAQGTCTAANHSSCSTAAESRCRPSPPCWSTYSPTAPSPSAPAAASAPALPPPTTPTGESGARGSIRRQMKK
jgi:hypothetical protein